MEEDDIIYPVHFFDHADPIRDSVMLFSWVFDDVLDAEKLHDALARLIEIGDWRKLGGRFRENNKTLQLHVPAKFTAQRPAVGYSHEVFTMKFRDHPLSHCVPESTRDAPLSYNPAFDGFKPLSMRPDAPRCMKDYLNGDHPVLSLHIVSFDDNTIVSLHIPHVQVDIMSLHAIIDAWSLVLAGDEKSVQPLAGVRQDLLYEATKTEKAAQERYIFAHLLITGFRKLLLVFFILWDALWSGSMEDRTICISRKSVQELRGRMLAEMPASDEKPWFSEADALLSVFTTGIARSSSSFLSRPIVILVPADVRARLPGIMDRNSKYIQNALIALWISVDDNLARHASAGRVALACRESLVDQTTNEQVLAQLVCEREVAEAGGYAGNIYMPVKARTVLSSNWNKAYMFHRPNFAPAVIKTSTTSDEPRANGPGIPFFVNSLHAGKYFKISPIVKFVGIDHQDNYWINGHFHAKTWRLIEEALAGL